MPPRALDRRLLPHEIRAIAAAALALTGGYGILVAIGGTWGALDCATDLDGCDVGVWFPVALAAATVLAIGACARAVPLLWRTARRGERPSAALRRFAVAWLAVLPFGVLFGGYPAAAQVLYSLLAVPGLVALLALSRVVVALRR